MGYRNIVTNCALDGPSGAGKSTIARAVARRLGYIYVDTGALYRAIGLYVTRRGADTKSPAEVEPLLSEIGLKLEYSDGKQIVLLNGEDVSGLIRTNEISMAASNVSAIPKVREFLLELQRSIAASNNIVMDGRDIGTVILPNANVKIFMTASAEVRAKRRYDELVGKGEDVSYETVLREINQRDYNDTHRDIAPLKKADDAIELDTSDMGIEEVVNRVCEIIIEKTSADSHRKKTLSEVRLFFYGIVRLGVRLAMRTMVSLKYEGCENVPRKGPYIVASNHISWVDQVYVSAGIRNISSYMAKESIFKNKLLSVLLRMLNAFPIKRGQSDRDALRTAMKYLNRGYSLTIFPEGTRSKDGKLGKGKSGVAFISHFAKCDVLPVGIKIDKQQGKRTRVTVRYGKPILYKEIRLGSSFSAAELRRSRDLIMSRIGELL